MNKRILFLTSTYPYEENPNAGIFVKYQCEALRKRHEVLLITVRVDYKKFGFFNYKVKEENNGKNIHLLIRHSFFIFNQIQLFLILFYETLRRGRKFSPDLIHANISYPGALWAFLSAGFLKRPYVVSEHTKLTNNYRSPVHKFLVNFGLRRARAITVVSRKHGEDFMTALQRTPCVVPNIVNLENFTLLQKNFSPLLHLGFAGNMETPVKGIDILLQALSQLKIDFKIQIAGHGQLLPSYKEQARTLGIDSKCIFSGFLPHAQVGTFLKQIDFLVCSSRYETFGLLMAEAIASGIPVVATRCGGPEDFVDNDNGLLVPAEDPVALAEAIEKMALSFRQYNRPLMREKIVSRFSEDKFLQNIESVYSAVSGRG